MLAIILVIFGAVCGGVTILFTGIPLVVLSVFRILPLDRRFWWCLAAVFSYFLAKDLVLSSYDYKVPTASPDTFYFDAHMLGSNAGVIVTFLLGLLILFFVGKPKAERTSKPIVAVPCLVIVADDGVQFVECPVEWIH